MQISYRWVYGFLIVGFRGIGWARLFYDLKTVRPMAFGLVAGLRVLYVFGHFGPTRTVPGASNVAYLYSAIRGPSEDPAQK